MSTRTEWLDSHVAPSKEALQAGDGCHSDEAKALGDYLESKLTTDEAAKAITAPVLQETDPPAELYRLMALFCEALLELNDDREKMLDLLASIQTLPPTSKIDWSQLPGFGNMWSDLYRLHFHGANDWEKTGEALTEPKKVELRQHYESLGTAEATLHVRGIGGIPPEWGYETLNLVCSRRPGLDVYIGSVHAWLTVAGEKLKRELKPEQVQSWTRLVGGGRPDQKQSVECTMTEHWETWNALLQVSEEDEFLSAEARKLAGECQRIMQGTV